MASFGCAPADRWASSLEDAAASNLASILEHLQTVDIYVEALADSVAGASGWWSAVTGLELWKVVCRLRLLGLQPSGRLMRSLLTEEEEAAAERDVARPQSTPVRSSQAPRRPRWSPAQPPSAASPLEPAVYLLAIDQAHLMDRFLDSVEGFVCRLACAIHPPLVASLRARLAAGCPALMATGEALHISQPIAHLLLRLATVHRRPGSVHRSIPGFHRSAEARAWVYAILIEGIAYVLCRRAATLTARAGAAAADTASGSHPTGGSGSRGACVGAGAGGSGSSSSVGGGVAARAAHNEDELRHRRRLLLQLLLRPLALGLIRRLIGTLAQGRGRGDWAVGPVGGLSHRAREERGRAGRGTARSGGGGGRGLGSGGAGSGGGVGAGWVQRTLKLIDSIDAVQPRYSGSGGWA